MDLLGLLKVKSFKGIDLSDVVLNHAVIYVNTTLENVDIYSLDDNCIGCPYRHLQSLPRYEQFHFQVDASKTTTWRIVDNAYAKTFMNRFSLSGLKCQLRPTLGEYGVYSLHIGTCHLREEVPPLNTYLPLIFFLLTILGITMASCVLSRLYNCYKEPQKEEILKKEPIAQKPGCKSAVLGFRGFLLSLLIFTTSGAGGYPILTDSYKGICFADCIYYAFIWTLGFRIPLAVNKAREEKNRMAVFLDILRRSLILLTVGLMIGSLNIQQNDDTAIWCPLERMAIAYFVAATIYNISVFNYAVKVEKLAHNLGNNFMSLLWFWVFGVFIFALQIMWINTIRDLNYPSTSNHDVTAISRSDDIDDVIYNYARNTTETINYIFLANNGVVHIDSYYGINKGLMGIFSTILPCLIGVKAGQVYLTHQADRALYLLWCAWGGLFMVAGVTLAGLSWIVKFNLWPIATVVVISSIPFFITSILQKLKRYLHLQALETFGITSLVILPGHLVFSRSIPFNWNSQLVYKYHMLYLIQNLWVVMLWMRLSLYFRKKKIVFDF